MDSFRRKQNGVKLDRWRGWSEALSPGTLKCVSSKEREAQSKSYDFKQPVQTQIPNFHSLPGSRRNSSFKACNIKASRTCPSMASHTSSQRVALVCEGADILQTNTTLYT